MLTSEKQSQQKVIADKERKLRARHRLAEYRAQSELSRDDMIASVQLINANTISNRVLLLEIRDKQGWFALDYPTMEEFARKELNISRQYLYRLFDAAEIEQILQNGHFGVNKLLTLGLPESHASALIKLKRVLTQTEQEYTEAVCLVYQKAIEQSQKETYKDFQGKPNPLCNRLTARIIANEVAKYLGLPEIPKATKKEKKMQVDKPKKDRGEVILAAREGIYVHLRVRLQDGTTVDSTSTFQILQAAMRCSDEVNKENLAKFADVSA